MCVSHLNARQATERVRGVTGPFRVIDVHGHVLNTEAEDLSAEARNYNPPGNVEKLIGEMDLAGVEHAFLLTYSAEDLAAEIRARNVDPVALKPVVNRAYQVAAWKTYRDRFWLFVNHSNPLRETFLDDLQRDFEAGSAGWKYMPIFYGFLADNPGYWPAFELCRKHQRPVIVDLSNWYIGQYPLYNEVGERQKLVRSFKDYATLLKPIFEEFHTVPICLAHVGTPGGRSKADVEQDRQAVLEFVSEQPNALIDTSPSPGMVPSAEGYESLVRAVGAEKIMWGTDWPFGKMDSWQMIEKECRNLSGAEKELIIGGNALRFVRGLV